MTRLEHHIEVFLAFMQGQDKSPDSIRSYAQTFRLFCQAGYDMISDQTVGEFLKRYTNVATANKSIGHFRSFATWYERRKGTDGIIGTFTIEQRKIPLRVPITVAPDEADLFFQTLREVSDMSWAHGVILRNTGLRFMEAWLLERSHRFEPVPGIRAIKFVGKGNRERIAVLNDAAWTAFEIWVTGDKPRPNTIRYHWQKALTQAGLSKIKPHWFRHTFATVLRNNNESYDDIADALGNTVEVTRARYSKMNYRSLERMVEAVV